MRCCAPCGAGSSRQALAQFYLRPSDVGRNRAEASLAQLRELNSHVAVRAASGPIAALVPGHNVVVTTGGSLATQTAVSAAARAAGASHVVAAVAGVYAMVFSDMGPAHTVSDTDGEQPIVTDIMSISRDGRGEVTTGTARHGLQTGAYVTFKHVKGMLALNDCAPRRVTVIGTLRLRAYLRPGGSR